jgi:hypothetical protein
MLEMRAADTEPDEPRMCPELEHTDTGSSVSVSDGPPSPKRTDRNRRGRFVTGNVAALKNGRFSMAVARALLPEQRETLAMLALQETSILADLGGEAELSTFERDLIRTYLQLDALAEFNAPLMFRTRAAVRRDARDAFTSAVDRKLKIIALLGARRRVRKAQSLEEYLMGRGSVVQNTDDADAGNGRSRVPQDIDADDDARDGEQPEPE